MSAASPLDIAILVLAAGASRRMRGQDKLMQQVEGQPLVRRQAQMARAVTTGPVVVALPPKPHPRYDALDGVDVTRLPVAAAAEGLGASLRTGFAALAPDCPAAMLLLADLPALCADDLVTVARAVDLTSDTLVWRGATQSGKPGHPIVVAAPLFSAFRALSGDTGGQDVIASVKDQVKLVPLPGNRARLDLDTPEDWAIWRSGGTP